MCSLYYVFVHFLHFNQLFQTNTQSFYIALSHIKIRTRNKLSAGVLNIREPQADGSGRNKYPRGGPGKNSKKNSKESHIAERIVAQCRKWIIPYLCTLPNTLGSCPKPKNVRQPIRIEYYVTRVERYVTRELSARVGDPSRLSARVGSLQPILIHEGLPPPPPPHLISSHSYYF